MAQPATLTASAEKLHCKPFESPKNYCGARLAHTNASTFPVGAPPAAALRARPVKELRFAASYFRFGQRRRGGRASREKLQASAPACYDDTGRAALRFFDSPGSLQAKHHISHFEGRCCLVACVWPCTCPRVVLASVFARKTPR